VTFRQNCHTSVVIAGLAAGVCIVACAELGPAALVYGVCCATLTAGLSDVVVGAVCLEVWA
jgi:hypothetical protein